MPDLGKAYVQIVPSAEGISGSITKVIGGETTSAGEIAGQNLAGSILKKLTAAGIGTAVGKLALDGIKASVSNFADYEQLVGGVETLFKSSAGTVQKYAANAYKTAGLSANQYMETVTSFSASLLQSLGGNTEKAAKMADMAITDMADNANKMGTSMESIQNAYQGFAKQNYTMLDNLKLGYGGTKSEMERLLEDAEKLSGIHYNIDSYADIVDAIHVVQDEMGITGTTAMEASDTISGSIDSAKAAWGNWVADLANDNADIEKSTEDLALSMATAINNIIPAVTTTVENLVDAILSIPDAMAKVKYAEFMADNPVESFQDLSAAIETAKTNVDEWKQKYDDALAYGGNPTYQAQQWADASQILLNLMDDIGNKEIVYQAIADGETTAAAAADLLNMSVEDVQRGLESYRQQTQAAASETDGMANALSEEENAAIETNQALAKIGLAAYDAITSGDDLRESYNELKKELDGLDGELDEGTLAIVEQRLAVLDLAATNQELVDGLSGIPGAMDYASGYTVQLSQALIDAGLTADDYVSSVASMRDGVVNSFKVIADESSITAEEMGNALSSNKETMLQWGTDLEALWAEAYANQDTAVMEYISYLADLGPEYATAVHDFASGGYDELQSQAQDFSEVGELSAKYTAEGIAAKAYLSSDEMGTLASDALAEYENQDFTQPGANSASDLAQGISNNAYLANTAMDGLVSDAYNTASSKTSDFYWVGYAMDTELASGLKAGANAVTEAAKTVAKRAYDAAKSVLKSTTDNSGVTENSIQSIEAYTVNAVPAPVPEQGGATVMNNYFSVSGAENPEDYAVRLARTLKLQMRMS